MSKPSLQFDKSILLITFSLLLIGLLMVCSSSITIAESNTGQPLFYFIRQSAFAVIGVAAAWVALSIRLNVWQRLAPKLMIGGGILLIMVLIPGVGREINGSSRWLPLGPVNLQVAELIKLFAIIYIADYVQRNQTALSENIAKVLTPLMVLGLAAVLLLLQPDMGSVVVILTTVMAMLFLAGARLDVFAGLIGLMGGVFALLIWQAPYRLQRLQTFLNPWEDQFGSGFQLTQALIAFGRGDWLGVGLGSSMQKLFYLPEAHTDFIYSILAEEFGFLIALAVLLMFVLFIWRALMIGRAAEKAGHHFGAQLAYGIGIWLGLQACVNIGVNMGALPTKGLTLPFISYGGSSLVIVCVAVALLLRVDLETRFPEKAAARVRQ